MQKRAVAARLQFSEVSIIDSFTEASTVVTKTRDMEKRYSLGTGISNMSSLKNV